MSYLLDSVAIRPPKNLEEQTLDLFAQQRSLNNAINRDYFGDTKRVWVFDYVNTQPSDYSTIRAIVDSYKSTSTAKSFESTETNYTIAATTVHLDLIKRGFTYAGSDYISDFSLVLTEA